MCFYYAILKKTDSTKLVSNQVITEKQLELFEDKHFVSGFDIPQMPVISNAEKDKIRMFQWGLVPKNIASKAAAKEFILRYNTLNAKAETIFDSKMYQRVVYTNRCLVLCSGFFEWRHKEPGKKGTKKYPFYITLKDNSMFVFGGVWDTYVDKTDGEIISSFSIITTGANGIMELIHNNKKRMPLIIEPERALEWLSEKEMTKEHIQSFFKPYPASQMKAYPIAKINPKLADQNNNPDVQAYYEYEELNEILEKHPDYFENTADLNS